MIVCTAIIQCLADLLLRNGNIELAKEHLIKSAQVVGSPVLGSFGPKFSLAKELLEHNEKKRWKTISIYAEFFGNRIEII